jgi:hypothetical protein
MYGMIEKTPSVSERKRRSSDLKCSSYGSEIFPLEIYYTLCVHMETRATSTDKINILEIRPLAFRCRLCEEKGIGVC